MLKLCALVATCFALVTLGACDWESGNIMNTRGFVQVSEVHTMYQNSNVVSSHMRQLATVFDYSKYREISRELLAAFADNDYPTAINDILDEHATWTASYTLSLLTPKQSIDGRPLVYNDTSRPFSPIFSFSSCQLNATNVNLSGYSDVMQLICVTTQNYYPSTVYIRDSNDACQVLLSIEFITVESYRYETVRWFAIMANISDARTYVNTFFSPYSYLADDLFE